MGKRAMRYLAWLRRTSSNNSSRELPKQTTRPTHATVGRPLVEIEAKHAIRAVVLSQDDKGTQRGFGFLKCNREFLAGWDGPTRRQIIDSLERRTRELVYRYFYCDPANPNPGDGENPARSPFEIFQAISKDYPEVRVRVEGYCIDYTDNVDAVKRESG